MAQVATSNSTWAGELISRYDRKNLMEPLERTDTPVWSMFSEADDVAPRGSGLKFRIILNTGHRIGTPSETGNIPGGQTSKTVQGTVNGVQVASSFEISRKAVSAGEDDGSFSGDTLHDEIVKATKNLYSHIERLLVVSHGTGKLGEVQTTTDTLTTAVMALPQGVFNIKPGMTLDFTDTDTGTVQVTGLIVDSVDFPTRTLTFTIATTLTAGWCAYISGYFNSAPNGIRGLVDDGTFLGSPHGLSRTTYPKMKAIVDSASGTPRPYKEKLLRKLIHRLGFESDAGVPTVLLCNTGVISEHLETTIPDRQYQVSGKQVPNYGIGYDGGNLFFQFENNKIPFKISRDVPARELYVLNMKTFKKHTLKKVNWFDGVDGPLLPTPATTTYSFTQVACLYGDLNISIRNPVASGVIRDLKDEELAGDSASA